jgi:nitrite reductase/ring-hydroxylating ferredoxin subunit
VSEGPAVPPGHLPAAGEQVRIARFPAALAAPSTREARYEDALAVADLPPGFMARVTFGDLDLLIAHTSEGIVATEDRCPHMSAPLSLGRLEGCVVDCPLHSGRFDLSTGETVRFPTTGGLDPEGDYHEPWSPPGAPPKPEALDTKARARALTRIRRVRFYPLRLRDGRIEVCLPG